MQHTRVRYTSRKNRNCAAESAPAAIFDEARSRFFRPSLSCPLWWFVCFSRGYSLAHLWVRRPRYASPMHAQDGHDSRAAQRTAHARDVVWLQASKHTAHQFGETVLLFEQDAVGSTEPSILLIEELLPTSAQKGRPRRLRLMDRRALQLFASSGAAEAGCKGGDTVGRPLQGPYADSCCDAIFCEWLVSRAVHTIIFLSSSWN